MNVRGYAVLRKKVRDFSSPKLLVLFFVPYVAFTLLFALGSANGLPDGFATTPLATQEQYLTQTFAGLSFVWVAGIPLMVLIAILVANGLAKEEQQGTLRILLTKPIQRWHVLLGTFLAVVGFGYLVAVTGLFIAGATTYYFSDASAAAIGASILSLLPGNLIYALLVALVLSSIATVFAVTTASRMQTILGTALVPGLFVAFLAARTFASSAGLYEEYYLYVVDLNYHFGNVFVFSHGLFGTEFSPGTQATLAVMTGVFDPSSWGIDPLVGGLTGSVPLSGHVPQVGSLGVLLGLSVLLLTYSTLHFERKDIS